MWYRLKPDSEPAEPDRGHCESGDNRHRQHHRFVITALPVAPTIIFVAVKAHAVLKVCTGVRTSAEIDHCLAGFVVCEHVLVVIICRAMTSFTLQPSRQLVSADRSGEGRVCKPLAMNRVKNQVGGEGECVIVTTQAHVRAAARIIPLFQFFSEHLVVVGLGCCMNRSSEPRTIVNTRVEYMAVVILIVLSHVH